MAEKTNYDRKSYTITDFYLSYKNYIEPGTQYDVDLKTFRAIVSDYFKHIKNEIMLNCREFKLPCRLGTLSIIKHKPKNYDKRSLRWDWKATKELGKPVFLLNDHSGYFKYRFFWSKQNCITKNKSKYMFIACRSLKRELAQIIFKQLRDYPEV